MFRIVLWSLDLWPWKEAENWDILEDSSVIENTRTELLSKTKTETCLEIPMMKRGAHTVSCASIPDNAH